MQFHASLNRPPRLVTDEGGERRVGAEFELNGAGLE
jgi:hypothetical protein